MNTTGSSSPPPGTSRKAKDLFGDCALVEIIHLHDCFRGALKNLEVDVSELCREINTAASIKSDNDMSPAVVEEDSNSDERIVDLERRVGKYYEYVFLSTNTYLY